ncbi:MAG: SH3 domain-containing protein [Candidatus Dependentiae bacterium]|nr:SH3 domain-containing protein [Candidatus Dependentiae bacterium]
MKNLSFLSKFFWIESNSIAPFDKAQGRRREELHTAVLSEPCRRRLRQYILVTILFSLHMVRADTTQELLLRAYTCYQQKDFSQAYTLYESIEPKDLLVWYNMGNCCYKLGNVVQAVAYWHKARRHALPEERATISYNIDVAEIQLAVSGEHGVLAKLERKLDAAPLFWLQIMFLFCWFSCFFFIKKYNRGTKYRALFGSILIIVTLSSGLAVVIKYKSLQQRGVVMKPNVSVFAGPDQQYHVVGVLNAACPVTLVEERESWCKIKHQRCSGWVPKEMITVV